MKRMSGCPQNRLNGGSPLEKYRELGQGEEWKLELFRVLREICSGDMESAGYHWNENDLLC